MDLIFKLADIQKTAAAVLQQCGSKKVFAFGGQMGAGKTTFIHAFCQALGVVDVVSSPTFSIINQYQAADGKPVYHIDLYRLKNEAEAVQAGVEDCIFSGYYCLVEWPSVAPALFEADTVYCVLSVLDNDTRKLTINM
jgi:tRNA threonylcarbamoyladenosine biosynthesis protein TsaE